MLLCICLYDVCGDVARILSLLRDAITEDDDDETIMEGNGLRRNDPEPSARPLC